MAKKKTRHFSPRLFAFLKDLRNHNEREWFNANKARYEKDVKEPFLDFIADFSGPLLKISPHFLADPRPSGGSFFRIYRDTRFAKDKSPYKTHAAAQFRHVAGKNVHAPGFYLHLEPGSVFAGAGIWRPDGKALARIRKAIATDSKTWKKAVTGKAFRDNCILTGDSLKRPPRGFDPEHPFVEDLKRKDFLAFAEFSESQAVKADFIGRVTKAFKSASPMIKFLAGALGLPF
ncbi:MAG: DUF2461 domain-containing protein [Planctomycetota bacterium]|jgi:uncharacterized protein (TIGR02453 family)